MLAIRGVIRGTIRQVFGFIGVLVGLWAAGWVSQWVGAHWHHARPAVVFWVMSWLVAGLAGLALASLAEWCGGLLAEAVKASPFGWLDRTGGLVLGAALGCVVATLVVFAMTFTAWPRDVRSWTESSRCAPMLLRGGATASDWAAPVLPRGRWLHERFLEAGRRVSHHAHAS